MTKKLLNNWPLKLGAAVAAILIWLAIMSYADPVDTRTISNIPITLLNENVITSAGKSFNVDGRLYATVKVNGTTSKLRGLTVKDFTATADIASLYDVTGQVPVNIVCNKPDILSSQLDLQTKSLKIIVEDILPKTLLIRTDIRGEVAEGFLLGKVEAKPSVVTVKAPVSVVEQIADAAVTVDVNGLSESETKTQDIVFYREDGSVLRFDNAKDTTFSAKTAAVNVEVLSVKQLPIVVSVGGMDKVADGYRFTGTTQSAASVKVSGMKSKLANISAVTIPDTDITVEGASTNLSVNIDLESYLPEGVTLVAGEEKILNVIMHVEILKVKNYSMGDRLELTGMDPEYEYSPEKPELILTFRALEDDFEHFDPAEIKAVLDLTGFEPGEYSLTPQVSFDPVFELIGISEIEVVITDLHAEEPDETDPENPDESDVSDETISPDETAEQSTEANLESAVQP